MSGTGRPPTDHHFSILTEGHIMTDLTLTPETAAAAAWDRAELALRLQWTRSRLMALSQLKGILTAADRVDAGRSIWNAYIDDRVAANPHARRTPAEISEQASVLADVARYVEQADVVAFAAAAWGSAEVEVHASDAVHLTWTPWTRIVLITRVLPNLVDVVETYAEPLDAHATGVPSA